MLGPWQVKEGWLTIERAGCRLRHLLSAWSGVLERLPSRRNGTALLVTLREWGSGFEPDLCDHLERAGVRRRQAKAALRRLKKKGLLEGRMYYVITTAGYEAVLEARCLARERTCSHD